MLRFFVLLCAASLYLGCSASPDNFDDNTPASVSDAIIGTVSFADGSPATWTTRIGALGSAPVCLQEPFCANDECSIMGWKSRCTLVQEDGSFRFDPPFEPAPTGIWLGTVPTLTIGINLMEEVDAPIGSLHHLSLDMDKDELLACQWNQEICDDDIDNNCNGVIDETETCMFGHSAKLIRTGVCSNPEARKVYHDWSGSKIRIPIMLSILRSDEGFVPIKMEDDLAYPSTHLGEIREAWDKHMVFTNKLFAPAGVEFVVADARFVDDSNYVHYDLSKDVIPGTELFGTHNEPGYLNVYLAQDIINGDGAGGFAAFPGQSARGIVMSWNFRIPWDGSHETSVAHEIGHFLSLQHTFGGLLLEGECYETGDMICDTPIDPGHEYCEFNEFKKNEDITNLCMPDYCEENNICIAPEDTCAGSSPMTNNVMGYFSPCQGDDMMFTEGQLERVLCSLDHEQYDLSFCVHGEDNDGDGFLCEEDCDDTRANITTGCLEWPTGGCQSADDCDDGNPCTEAQCMFETCLFKPTLDKRQCDENNENMRCARDKCIEHTTCTSTDFCAKTFPCHSHPLCIKADDDTKWCVMNNGDHPDGTECAPGKTCQKGMCLGDDCSEDSHCLDGTEDECNTHVCNDGICEDKFLSLDPCGDMPEMRCDPYSKGCAKFESCSMDEECAKYFPCKSTSKCQEASDSTSWCFAFPFNREDGTECGDGMTCQSGVCAETEL